MLLKLAGDLASWKAKCKVLKDAGSTDLPKGKPGNHITRMYERTGWWPLKRESELWTKAIDQFGVTPLTPNVSSSTDADLTKELGPEVSGTYCLTRTHAHSLHTHNIYRCVSGKLC